MIPLSLALAILVGSAVLVVAHAVRLGRRSTGEAVSSLSHYGYGAATAPLTTKRQGRRPQGDLPLERSLARVAGRLSPADYERQLRVRLLQAGMYSFRPSRFLMIRIVSAVGLA